MTKSLVIDSFAAKGFQLVFACEHGGHKVPPSLKYLEQHQQLDTESHIAWDPGALEATRFLSEKLNAPYFANEYSRLLIDCNRSDDNPGRFPRWTQKLSDQERRQIETAVFFKYKSQVRNFVKTQLRRQIPVVMISVHSFTPIYNGQTRSTEIGVLYRPWAGLEKLLGESLITHLKQTSDFKVHRNLPYRGHTDCFLNELSQELRSPELFTGIMFELNYGLRRSQSRWNQLQWSLATAVSAVLG